MLEELSGLNDVEISKSGQIDYLYVLFIPIMDREHVDTPTDMFEFQKSITHLTSPIENASHYVVHFICSQYSPYPSITLHRSTWPAVCLLFTLPTLPSCYYREDEGKSFKITSGDEYVLHRSRNYSFGESLDPIPPLSIKESIDIPLAEVMTFPSNEESSMSIEFY